MNYLEKVKEFRTATGLDAGQPIELHDKLIREEWEELFRAAYSLDRAGVADGIADIMVVTCGKYLDGYTVYREIESEIWKLDDCARAWRINLDAAFQLVHESNMSKLCTTDELKPTMAKYEAIGVTLEIKPVQDGLFAVFSATDHPDYPKGKLLKSVGYHEPDWSGDEWIMEG